MQLRGARSDRLVWLERERMTNILANSLMAAAANSDLIYASRVSSVQHSHRSHTKVL